MKTFKRFRSLVIAIGALAMMSSGARAAVVTVLNAGFEDPATILNFAGSGGPYSTVMTDWTIVGGAFSAGNFAPVLGSDTDEPWEVGLFPGPGSRTAWSNGGALEQITGATITSGLTYNLLVDVGDRKDINPDTLSDHAFGGGRIELFAATSGTVLASTELFGGPGDGLWDDFLASFISDGSFAGEFLGIRLDGDGIQTNFDNVALSAVPIPPALWLFLSSLIGLAAVVRHRRKRKTARSPEFATAT